MADLSEYAFLQSENDSSHNIFVSLWAHGEFIFTKCKVMSFPCPIHNRIIIVMLIEHFMLKGENVMIIR